MKLWKKCWSCLLDFPDRFQSRLARYLLAESYRHAADEPLKKSAEAENQNELKLDQALAKELLEQALANYGKLQVELTLEVEGDELTARCCGTVTCCRAMCCLNWDAGVKRLRRIRTFPPPGRMNRLCWKRWCKSRTAGGDWKTPSKRGAIEQAKLVLARLPADADFAEATNFNRTEWGNLLAQMSAWYPSNQVTAGN